MRILRLYLRNQPGHHDVGEQLRAHLAIARDNGIKEEELIEAITHLAFYAGWPSAVTAITVAREVFRK
jgi:4-carboxymuconolactone decarboxylase